MQLSLQKSTELTSIHVPCIYTGFNVVFVMWLHNVVMWLHNVVMWLHNVVMWLHNVIMWLHNVVMWLHNVFPGGNMSSRHHFIPAQKWLHYKQFWDIGHIQDINILALCLLHWVHILHTRYGTCSCALMHWYLEDKNR